MNMKLRNIPFSPPDMSDAEIEMVAEALRSGWITTGPKTKEFEQLIAICCGTEKAVCLNSATACMESILRALGAVSYTHLDVYKRQMTLWFVRWLNG